MDHYRRAVALRRAGGSTYLEADTLVRLGEVYADLGRHGDTRQAWDRAVGLYRAQHRTTEADGLVSRLATME